MKLVEDCANWHQITISRGNHCWNCAKRYGYPYRAQPDKNCSNYSIIPRTKNQIMIPDTDMRGEMTMKQAMAEAVLSAKKYGHSYCLYSSKSQGWLLSPIKWNDWLFKAYPGGRKILSVAGKKKMEELGEKLEE